MRVGPSGSVGGSEHIGRIEVMRQNNIPELARDSAFDDDALFPREITRGTDMNGMFARHETRDVDRIIEEAEALLGDTFAVDIDIHRFRDGFDGDRARKDKDPSLETVAVAKGKKEYRRSGNPK